MLAEKKVLSMEDIERQTALELPDREMLKLVTVVVGDVEILVPIGIAANLCNINAAVLAQQFVNDQDARCTAVVRQ